MKKSILQTLRTFTDRTSVDLSLTAEPLEEAAHYAPIGKYIHDLKLRTKPETASEDLFRGLAKDVLGVTLFSQINTGDGFVDFIVPEVNGEVLIELKPLFHRYDDTELRRHPVKPDKHLPQVKGTPGNSKSSSSVSKGVAQHPELRQAKVWQVSFLLAPPDSSMSSFKPLMWQPSRRR